MKKQKICIIGGSLTGLATATCLSNLNIDIDLIVGNYKLNLKTNRTIAISQNNFNFLKKFGIINFNKKELWPCSNMKLYHLDENKKFSEILEFKKENKKKEVLYMLENQKIIKNLMMRIKKIKSINVIKNKTISDIGNLGSLKTVKFNNTNHQYNLIIICTGSDSNLVKNIFHEKSIQDFYEEISITTTISHKKLNNNIVRQVFLDDEILALLPISNNRTSIVWSVNQKKYQKNDLVIKKKLNYYLKNYFKKINFLTKIEYKKLHFLIRKN